MKNKHVDQLKEAIDSYNEENYDAAFMPMVAAANKGYVKANYPLARMYVAGLGTDKNDSEAVKHYRLAAEEGHVDAQYELGVMYEYGKGVEKNEKEAIHLYQRAAKKNHAIAQNTLGDKYQYGGIVKKSIKNALNWYQLAACQGYKVALVNLKSIAMHQRNAQAQYILAVIYHNGFGMKPNMSEAMKWYQLAANQNHAEALYDLGKLYIDGVKVEKNERKAEGFFWLSAEQGHFYALHHLRMLADKGNLNAQYHLGVIYEFGLGVESNYPMAINRYQRAAKRGHGGAKNRLGIIYADGLVVEKNELRAIEYFASAADKKHSAALNSLISFSDHGNSDAQYRLGIVYLNRSEIEEDQLKALECFQKAAEQGHVEAKKYIVYMESIKNSNVKYQLGKMYFKGLGVKQDKPHAVQLFEQSARQDNAFAKYKLGLINKRGIERVVIKNEIKAARLFWEAAEQGHKKAQIHLEEMSAKKSSEAQYYLGVLYINDRGVDKNARKAIEYFLEANAQGHIDAQYQLGVIYELGELNVPKDLTKAMEYYRNAAQNGHAAAPGALKSLEKELKGSRKVFPGGYSTYPILLAPPHPYQVMMERRDEAERKCLDKEYTFLKPPI